MLKSIKASDTTLSGDSVLYKALEYVSSLEWSNAVMLNLRPLIVSFNVD